MRDSDNAAFMLDLRMVKAGAVLAAAGMMLAAAGTGLVGAALTRATRDWLSKRDVSPSSMAAERVRQARHASMAGAHAWRSYQMTGANGASPRR